MRVGREARAVGTSVLAYADDLCAIGESKEEALFIAQRMVTLLGAINIRVQAKKCVYMRSLQAAINADDIHRSELNPRGLQVHLEDGRIGLIERRHPLHPTMVTVSTKGADGAEAQMQLEFRFIEDQLVDSSLVGIRIMTKYDPAASGNMAASKEGMVTCAMTAVMRLPRMMNPIQCTVTLSDKTIIYNMSFSDVMEAAVRRQRADLPLTAMDAKGELKCMTCARVQPYYNEEGESPEERGATRYLGI